MYDHKINFTKHAVRKLYMHYLSTKIKFLLDFVKTVVIKM